MFQLFIPATNGRIGWKHVAAAMAEALQLDQGSIEELLPVGDIKLDSPAVSLSLLAINLAVGDRLDFAVTYGEEQRLGLMISSDSSRLHLQHDDTNSKVTIHHDEGIAQVSHGRPIVLCLHGVDGMHETFDGMRQELRECGYQTAAISYASECSIAVVAREVSRKFAALMAAAPVKPRLVLVGHSMGGLVAREWTSNDALENDAIVGLITIGTPHQGSAWATLPPLLNLFTKGEFGLRDVGDVILHAPSKPELRDIAPGSPFLENLNARVNRPDVQSTSVIGVRSPLDAATVAQIQKTFRQLEQQEGFVRLIRPRIQPLLHRFDELIDGCGDGIVSAESACMPSTSDLVRLDLSHFELVQSLVQQDAGERAGHPVWQIVVERVARCCQKT